MKKFLIVLMLSFMLLFNAEPVVAEPTLLVMPPGCNVDTIAASEVDINYIDPGVVFIEIFFKQDVTLGDDCVLESSLGVVPLGLVMGPATGQMGVFAAGEYVVVFPAPPPVPPGPPIPFPPLNEGFISLTSTNPLELVWCYEWDLVGPPPGICANFGLPMGGMSLQVGPANEIISETCTDTGDGVTCSNDAGLWTASFVTPGGPNPGLDGSPLVVKLSEMHIDGETGASLLVVGLSIVALVAVATVIKRRAMRK